MSKALVVMCMLVAAVLVRIHKETNSGELVDIVMTSDTALPTNAHPVQSDAVEGTNSDIQQDTATGTQVGNAAITIVQPGQEGTIEASTEDINRGTARSRTTHRIRTLGHAPKPGPFFPPRSRPVGTW